MFIVDRLLANGVADITHGRLAKSHQKFCASLRSEPGATIVEIRNSVHDPLVTLSCSGLCVNTINIVSGDVSMHGATHKSESESPFDFLTYAETMSRQSLGHCRVCWVSASSSSFSSSSPSSPSLSSQFVSFRFVFICVQPKSVSFRNLFKFTILNSGPLVNLPLRCCETAKLLFGL